MTITADSTRGRAEIGDGDGVERQVVALAAGQAVACGQPDHRGVVGAVAQRRNDDLDAELGRGGARAPAQAGIGGDAAGDDQAIDPGVTGGGEGGIEQHVDHRFLEARRDVGPRRRGRAVLAHVQRHRGLDAAEAEVEAVSVRGRFEARAREARRAGVALLGERIDRAAAGIAEAEQLGDFVERFAGGVVARRPEQRIIAERARQIEARMAAGDEQRDVRQRDRALELHRQEVALEMVDADERQLPRVGDGLGRAQADEQRADQSGTVGGGDGIDLVERERRLVQRALDRRRQCAHVAARGELGDDAAVGAVDVVLRGDDAGAHLAIDQHRGGGVVARALDGQHSHGGVDGRPPTRAKPAWAARLPGAALSARA
jgi:hypothetical protein